MPKLQLVFVSAALALSGAAPAIADGYHGGPTHHGYEPAAAVTGTQYVAHGRTEVSFRNRRAPAYGHRAVNFDAPPRLWRQREVAIDAIFTRDKRIIYDAGRAAQTRAALGPYGPVVHYRPPAAFIDPIVDPAGSCGTFRYWTGAGCVDARFFSRYRNPYKWKYLRK